MQVSEGKPDMPQDPVQRPGSTEGVRKISGLDIQLVQNLIERCLQLYMSRTDVINTLYTQAKIETGFTSLVWSKLEDQNRDFFRAYYTRLKLMDQIMLFNQLLEHHRDLVSQPRNQSPMGGAPPGVQGNPGMQQGQQYPVMGQPNHMQQMPMGPSQMQKHPNQGGPGMMGQQYSNVPSGPHYMDSQNFHNMPPGNQGHQGMQGMGMGGPGMGMPGQGYNMHGQQQQGPPHGNPGMPPDGYYHPSGHNGMNGPPNAGPNQQAGGHAGMGGGPNNMRGPGGNMGMQMGGGPGQGQMQGMAHPGGPGPGMMGGMGINGATVMDPSGMGGHPREMGNRDISRPNTPVQGLMQAGHAMNQMGGPGMMGGPGQHAHMGHGPGMNQMPPNSMGHHAGHGMPHQGGHPMSMQPGHGPGMNMQQGHPIQEGGHQGGGMNGVNGMSRHGGPMMYQNQNRGPGMPQQGQQHGEQFSHMNQGNNMGSTSVPSVSAGNGNSAANDMPVRNDNNAGNGSGGVGNSQAGPGGGGGGNTPSAAGDRAKGESGGRQSTGGGCGLPPVAFFDDMLNQLPRNFSLSDLSIELGTQLASENDSSLALFAGLPGNLDTMEGDNRPYKLPRNFSLSDMALEFEDGKNEQ